MTDEELQEVQDRLFTDRYNEIRQERGVAAARQYLNDLEPEASERISPSLLVLESAAEAAKSTLKT
ncbi:MAG: hypothetical protein IID30_09840 [Planctomycetes bacterium]|nr:hypothetical protein [Planctomycetota bacterium]